VAVVLVVLVLDRPVVLSQPVLVVLVVLVVLLRVYRRQVVALADIQEPAVLVVVPAAVLPVAALAVAVAVVKLRAEEAEVLEYLD
jgi:hypothetical protein